MERERVVIEALLPAEQHRMAELALMGWRFQYKERVMAGATSGWVAFSPDQDSWNDRFAASLHSLIGYVNSAVGPQP